jgi:uncharacterized protein YgbK (DUF1537 family)
MPKIGVVADDLTGATTTGVLLARSKARTVVFFNEDAAQEDQSASESDAILVSSNSRALPGNEAYQKVSSATTALKNMGIEFFSKRIDTTLRGGIGIEIDAMMDTIGNDVVAVVVPAMPQSSRILVGGYSIIDRIPLIKTPVAQDVRTPVYENYIPKLLDGQSRRAVGTVSLGCVLQGVVSIQRELKKERLNGAEIIVVDAVSIEDVEAIAQACVNLRWNVLAVDPGPFTTKLAYVRGLVRTEEPNIPEGTTDGTGKAVLIAAGSATPVTKRQMDVLCEDARHLRISVEPVPLIDGGQAAVDEVDRAIEIAIKMLEERNPRAILIETALHGELLDLDQEDKKHGYAGGMSAERINAGLGRIIAGILEQVERERIAGIYTTGGDTMVNVCFQMSVECLEVVDYVIPQTDVGRIIGGKYQGMPMIGKGGLTGDDHTALDIVERLFKEAARKK